MSASSQPLSTDAQEFITLVLKDAHLKQDSRSKNPDVVSWIEHEFYIPEMIGSSNPAMPLADYQKAVLREAHRKTADGKFVYDLVLWSDIKKSAKSSIAAAVILYRALHMSYGSFKIIANDLKQADSRVFYYIRRAIELNPLLAHRATVHNYKITLDNHTVIEAIPVDPSGEAGANDDFLEWTELHASSSKAALKMWSEMTIPPTKHGYAQRWIDTYAGNSGEAPILEPLYEKAVKQGERLTLPDAPADLEVYRSGSVFALWNTKPRLEWQTPEYYASESSILLPNEFQRIHRNQWTSSSDVFVPAEWWSACQTEMPPTDDYTPIVLGMDAAISGDCFAIVGVSREGETVSVRYVNIWAPNGGMIDFGEPEAELRRLATQYNIVEVAYDPYQLHDMARRLGQELFLFFREFNQGADRLIADKELRDCIMARRIRHSGESNLREHVLNANSKEEGEKLRIIKRSENLKIDACVALSMAHSEARRLNLG